MQLLVQSPTLIICLLQNGNRCRSSHLSGLYMLAMNLDSKGFLSAFCMIEAQLKIAQIWAFPYFILGNLGKIIKMVICSH